MNYTATCDDIISSIARSILHVFCGSTATVSFPVFPYKFLLPLCIVGFIKLFFFFEKVGFIKLDSPFFVFFCFCNWRRAIYERIGQQVLKEIEES